MNETDESKDPLLENLFQATAEDLEDDCFTAGAKSATGKFLKRQFFGMLAAVIVLLTVLVLLSEPLLQFGLLLAGFLAMPMIEITGWMGWLIYPINHIGVALVLSIKLVQVLWRALTGSGKRVF